MQCSLVERYQYLEKSVSQSSEWFHLQLHKQKAAGPSEMLLTIYQTTQHHTSVDSNPYVHMLFSNNLAIEKLKIN